jgi:hypothetical protein
MGRHVEAIHVLRGGANCPRDEALSRRLFDLCVMSRK